MNNRVLPIGIIKKYENEELSKESWEPSEYKLAKYLDKNLPSEWVIFTKPEFTRRWSSLLMEKLTPDIVIAHPQNGIMIFEVKEWNINSYISKENCQKKKFEIFVITDERNIPVQNPVNQARKYFEFMKNNIHEILSEIDENKIKDQLLWYGVYMCSKKDAKFSQKDAEKFLGFPRYVNTDKCKIITDELIEKNQNINKIIPLLSNKLEIKSSSNWLISFKDWISPPLHIIEKDVITEQSLDEKQRRYVQPRSNMIQKLCGVCGSGKTVVIAMRAAKLASLEKRVLIVCYNITLKNYIKELIQRTPYKFRNDNITVTHFHEFLREYMNAKDIDYENIDSDITIKRAIKDREKDEELTSSFDSSSTDRFDAILIDEGQDFEQLWFEFLKHFLSENKEILITIDGKQNVYDRKKIIAGIGAGRWAVLKKGYRLLNPHINLINSFSKKFLIIESKDLETPLIEPHSENQHTLPFIPEPDIKAYYTNSRLETKIKLKEILDYLDNNKKHKISDTAVLVSNHEEGLSIKKFIESAEFNTKIKTSDIFRIDKDDIRQAKVLFKVKGNSLKLCTIKSFKGWERRNIIIIISGKISSDKEIYTALSRVREKLFIIDQNSKYKEFFSTHVKATL